LPIWGFGRQMDVTSRALVALLTEW
jgi:hypothetical protein